MCMCMYMCMCMALGSGSGLGARDSGSGFELWARDLRSGLWILGSEGCAPELEPVSVVPKVGRGQSIHNQG